MTWSVKLSEITQRRVEGGNGVDIVNIDIFWFGETTVFLRHLLLA